MTLKRLILMKLLHLVTLLTSALAGACTHLYSTLTTTTLWVAVITYKQRA
jgi:uncharacterized membrane protein